MEVFENNYSNYVLYVEDLSVEYTISGRRVHALSHATFGLKENEAIGIVGESGCGKSTLALAIAHILPQNSVVTSGRIYFKGEVIVDSEKGGSYSLQNSSRVRKAEKELSTVRWKGISIVFQGALDSLNPLLKVGEQISDIFVFREKMPREEAKTRSVELLSAVGLEPWVMDSYPHQLSGGMKQRVIIAMAISLHPSLIIADEPTTSLDVITEYRIIEQIRELRDKYKVSLLSISHDIAMVSNLSDRIFVMYAGRIVEKLPGVDLDSTLHPYSFLLKESIPKIWGQMDELLPIKGAPPGLIEEIRGCPFYERCDYHMDLCQEPGSEDLIDMGGNHEVACPVLPLGKPDTGKKISGRRVVRSQIDSDKVLEVESLQKIFLKRSGFKEKKRTAEDEVRAVDDVSFFIRKGESLSLVGETGSGKTTLSRIIGILETPTSGSVKINGEEINFEDEKSHYRFRDHVQTIFQDPFQSLNPRFSIGKIVSEPLDVMKDKPSPVERDRKVREAMRLAELTPVEDYINKYPHQLSGGQRQRVSIARALVRDPEILVADEPISMLDVSLRAGVLNLMKKLRQNLHISIFYITHDIASARYISDRIMVMYKGQIVESGDTETIMQHPAHPYTVALIVASMGLKGGTLEQLGDKIFSSPKSVFGNSCRFSTRCPFATSRCEEEDPPEREINPGHHVKCHYAEDIVSFTTENEIKPGVNMKSLKTQMGR